MTTPSRQLDPASGTVIATATLIATVTVGLISGTVPGFDRSVLTAAHALRAPALDVFFATITWLGSLIVLAPLALLVAIACLRRGLRRAAWLAVGALTGAAALSHVVKLAFARPRPDLFTSLTPMPADASFPSAHAAQVAALSLAMLLGLRNPHGLAVRFSSTVFVAAIIGLATLTALVALSRLYLQVHFPSDVLAGLLVGSGCALGLHRIIGDDPPPFSRGAG